MRRASVSWYTLLDEGQQQSLLRRGQLRVIKANTIVVRRGDPALDFFIIRSGRLKVAVANAKGGDTTFDVLGPDDVFGEIGLFGEGVRTADVKALEPCELYVLRQPELLQAIKDEPQVALVLLRVMAERVNALTETLEENAELDAGTRFARSLVKLAERFGVEPVPANLQVRIKLSQQDLADLVGVSRVFANGRLREWQQQGILTHRNGQLNVHDLPALRRVAAL